MKRVNTLLFFIALLFCSCNHKITPPEIEFFLNGEEVVTDSVYADINSQVVLDVATYASTDGFSVLGSVYYILEYPNGVIDTMDKAVSDNFRIKMQSSSLETAQFSEFLSDTIYQTGDKLKFTANYHEWLKPVEKSITVIVK